MKKIITIVVIIILIALGIYIVNKGSTETVENTDQNTEIPVVATTTIRVPVVDNKKTVIGVSADDLEITAYHYGQGKDEILFIGGVHGGYAWNTVEASYKMMEYLSENLKLIPENVKVTIIPVLNPDGLNEVFENGSLLAADVNPTLAETIPGRFNGNDVDLNRNFDCDWQTSATWQNKTVSGGTAAFSEPETLALKNYVEKNKPVAVISLDSAAGGVFASSCHNGVSTETLNLVSIYSEASGYKAYKDFDFYEVTGDMTNWLAKIKVPAITVLLTTHDDIEWAKNLAGIKAILENYAK